ncbi:hypothetical protein ACKQTC_05390 [Peptococcus simiae]|uniref:Nuclease-related domain-containing protein n=1 Tax=Peptococcus simiae TaxID=1643805 RepID=A0ABW9GZR5_9FIRM
MMTEMDWVLLALLCSLGVFILGYRAWQRFQGKRRRARGKKKEIQAEKLLKEAGYRILSRQKKGHVAYYIDGQRKEQVVHADYWVGKGWHHYVVEVKSGRQANPQLAAVRRQLLEYKAVFRPHGILFVDMEKKKIRRVDFEGQARSFIPWLAGSLLGVIVALAIQLIIR